MKKIFVLLMIAFTALCTVPVEAAPKLKEQPRVRVDQGHLIDQFKYYFMLKGRHLEVAKSNYEVGLCNGFAFLAQYYTSLGKQDEYFEALSIISTWDLSTKSLKEPRTLLGQYSSLEDLMEQWFNDLVWFQYTHVTYATYINLFMQSNRIDQFELFKQECDHRRIEMLFQPFMYGGIDSARLEEILEIWSSFPNTILEFGGGRHATSARVLENGKFFYYDSNFNFKHNTVNSPKELAALILKTKYPDWTTKTVTITVMAYQYVEPGEEVQLPKTVKSRKKSPNGFTQYHQAIFANDMAALEALVSTGKVNPNTAESHGMTPLALAILMGNQQAIEILMRHSGTDVEAGQENPLITAVRTLNADATVALLRHGARLFVTAKDHYDIFDIVLANKKGVLSIIEIPAFIMGSMRSDRELAYVREIARQIPDLYSLIDHHGNTLLHFAALNKNTDLYNMLVNEGADPMQMNVMGERPCDVIKAAGGTP